MSWTYDVRRALLTHESDQGELCAGHWSLSPELSHGSLTASGILFLRARSLLTGLLPLLSSSLILPVIHVACTPCSLTRS